MNHKSSIYIYIVTIFATLLINAQQSPSLVIPSDTYIFYEKAIILPVFSALSCRGLLLAAQPGYNPERIQIVTKRYNAGKKKGQYTVELRGTTKLSDFPKQGIKFDGASYIGAYHHGKLTGYDHYRIFAYPIDENGAINLDEPPLDAQTVLKVTLSPKKLCVSNSLPYEPLLLKHTLSQKDTAAIAVTIAALTAIAGATYLYKKQQEKEKEQALERDRVFKEAKYRAPGKQPDWIEQSDIQTLQKLAQQPEEPQPSGKTFHETMAEAQEKTSQLQQQAEESAQRMARENKEREKKAAQEQHTRQTAEILRQEEFKTQQQARYEQEKKDFAERERKIAQEQALHDERRSAQKQENARREGFQADVTRTRAILEKLAEEQNNKYRNAQEDYAID